MPKSDFDKTVLVAIDFDGTLTKEDRYPDTTFEIDKDAVRWAKMLQEKGAQIILWTCRDGNELRRALNALNNAGLIPNYINEGNGLRNDDKRRKVNADVYIDDRANDGVIDWPRIVSRVSRLIKERRLM